ncbi:hypothetical protein C4D60_Mb06t22760 [Musa balbisiana]|uniref:Pseudouridine-5'-phosphate glycosidase n=1 Tax=Musa balbisiana TaxID=52838 RepID=A0A4S8IQ51_MUSBA|nr:hypothetical protein C4D60_Mb06t22760 [Musa balbisiana]
MHSNETKLKRFGMEVAIHIAPFVDIGDPICGLYMCSFEFIIMYLLYCENLMVMLPFIFEILLINSFCLGMPYPQNLQTAKEVEAIVRENGAVPATIAILDGVPCIGLNISQLERLAKLGINAQKTSRRDIPHVVAAGSNGATTVSATMFFASKVGIPVFVTGGIGGVHRHGETTMDISSDLTELGKTPVAVISAGVKSILDIPRTLEYLETQGVTVATYKTNEFPAFFSGTSGCKVPCRVDTPEQCARLIHANLKLGLGSGMLIAVPIPEKHVSAGNVIESAIQKALEEAKLKNVTGNAATPFLLARVNELTGGVSLAASILFYILLMIFPNQVSDITLVKNNAFVGAKIAVALANLQRCSKNEENATSSFEALKYHDLDNVVYGQHYEVESRSVLQSSDMDESAQQNHVAGPQVTAGVHQNAAVKEYSQLLASVSFIVQAYDILCLGRIASPIQWELDGFLWLKPN